MYTPEQVARACQVPLVNAQQAWPLLTAAMREFGIWTPGTAIAIAANVAEETNHTMLPIEEYGDEAYFRNELGDQWFYHGRGYDQTTWLDAYRRKGTALGLDLVNHPELLLIPANSARATAWFVRDKGIPEVAEARNWYGVRRLWNGGLNGIDMVMTYVNAMLSEPYPPDVPPLAGRTLHVVTLCGLKQSPDHMSDLAIGERRQRVMLHPGTVVTATGKESADGAWLEVRLAAPSPVHGWALKETLR